MLQYCYYALVICMYAPPPIHGGEMRGIPSDIGGNSMSIPPEIFLDNYERQNGKSPGLDGGGGGGGLLHTND